MVVSVCKRWHLAVLEEEELTVPKLRVMGEVVTGSKLLLVVSFDSGRVFSV